MHQVIQLQRTLIDHAWNYEHPGEVYRWGAPRSVILAAARAHAATLPNPDSYDVRDWPQQMVEAHASCEEERQTLHRSAAEGTKAGITSFELQKLMEYRQTKAIEDYRPDEAARPA